MSLVIGYADGDIGFLVADTLLSHQHEKYDPRNPIIEKFHSLKIHILAPDVAVAFAGDLQASLSIIQRLHGDLTTDSKHRIPERILELRQEFTASTYDSQRYCEFLVLLLSTNRDKKRLVHISGNEIRDVQFTYIGDTSEYETLQKLIKPYEGPEVCSIQNADGTFRIEKIVTTAGERKFMQISSALKNLTHQRNSQTVGAICGCITRVVDARISRDLEYLQEGEASLSPAEGPAGFSLLASNCGNRGIGIYYRALHKGLVFIVGDTTTCLKEAATTIQQFVEVAKSKYGLNLEGGAW